ncbi:MAG TPA: hypothetical protein VF914_07330 [Chloroflexia bacterium]
MEEPDSSSLIEQGHSGAERPHRKRSGMRVLKIGCLTLLLTLCGSLGLLAWGLQSGPMTLQLLGSNTLKVGSDDFVLSNYSFQNGTTFYIDLNGNGVRNILQVHYLEDTNRLELVLHYADKSALGEHHLAELTLP